LPAIFDRDQNSFSTRSAQSASWTPSSFPSAAGYESGRGGRPS
jgi:hypothetical protein